MLVKIWLILQYFGKIEKKKVCQNGKFGSVAPVIHFFFFFLWPSLSHSDSDQLSIVGGGHIYC